MSHLWVPPRVSRELEEGRKQHEADLAAMFVFDGHILSKWNKELRKIDPLLRLGRARDKAHAPGVVPGFYHLVRFNPGAPPWVQALHNNGQFVEPSSRMLEMLKASDLQNARAVYDRKRADEEAARAEEKAKQVDHEERVDDAVELVKANTQVRISMNKDTPWSQNVAGRRGVKKDAAPRGS